MLSLSVLRPKGAAICAAFLFALSGAACASESVKAIDNDDQPPDGLDPGPVDDGLRFLEVIGSSSLEMPALDSRDLVVRLYDSNGDGVVGETIDFVLGVEAEDSTLSIGGGERGIRISTATRSGGIAVAQINSGGAVVSFEVAASSGVADPVKWTVQAGVEATTGDLDVVVMRPVPDGPNGEVEVIELGLYALGAEVPDCQTLDDLMNGATPPPAAHVGTLWRNGNRHIFALLPAGSQWVARAVGYSATTHPIAFGCTLAGPVPGDDVARASIELELINIALPTTEYTTGINYPLYDDMPGVVRRKVDDLTESVRDPARHMSDELIDATLSGLLDELGFIGDLLEDLAKAEIRGVLEDYFTDNLAYKRVTSLALELPYIMNGVEVVSQLGVAPAPPPEDGAEPEEPLPPNQRRVIVTEAWLELWMQSGIFCEGTPSRDCDQDVMDVRDLGISASFAGVLDETTGIVTFEQHTLTADFAVLFRRMFERHIMPAIAGNRNVSTVGGAFAAVVDCANIASNLGGDLPPIANRLVERACVSFVSSMTADLDRAANDVAGVQTQLERVSGSLTLSDGDLDRTLDRLDPLAFTCKWVMDPAQAPVAGPEFQVTGVGEQRDLQ